MMNWSSTNTRTHRPHPARRLAAALALLLVSLAAPVGAAPGKYDRSPDLGDCQALEVPAGNKLAFAAYAEGVQIYRWDGATWSFVAPEAVLFTGGGESGVIGIHYAGPTWESASGSKVVAAVVDRCTPDPSAIPWLLLRAVSSEGPGLFHRITYIQRVNTTGGTAPSDPGTSIGEVARVPYTADYLFYREH